MKKSSINNIEKMVPVLEKAQTVLDAIYDTESDAFESKSDAWQESDRGMEAEELLDLLGEACDNLRDAISSLSEIK